MSVIRSDGAGKPQPLTQSKKPQYPSSFTPDGTRLAFFELSSGTGFDLWTVALESDGGGLRAGKPEVFLQTPAEEQTPSFSPDGRWLAYASDESGTFQVCVRAFPDKGGKWQISNSGGTWPMWSRDGRELAVVTQNPNDSRLPAPVVFVDAPALRLPCVVSDDLVGSEMATRHLIERGHRFDTDNDTEVGARLIADVMEHGGDLEVALKTVVATMDGFFTLLVTTRDEFAVVRDAFACKPLVVAESPDYVAVASEYCALAGLPGIEQADVFEPMPEEVHSWTRGQA